MDIGIVHSILVILPAACGGAAAVTEAHCPECDAPVTTRTLEKRTLNDGLELVEVPYRCSNPTCPYHHGPFPYAAFRVRDHKE